MTFILDTLFAEDLVIFQYIVIYHNLTEVCRMHSLGEREQAETAYGSPQNCTIQQARS